MKKLIGALILGALLYTGAYALSFVSAGQPSTQPLTGEAAETAPQISIDLVLRAHNARQGLELPTAFSAEAVRLTSRPRGTNPELPSFFERTISVVVAGNAYRRYTADPLREREQLGLFDGSLPYHALIEEGRPAGGARQMNATQARSFEKEIKRFGLLPILKELSDPATEAVYVGRTEYGHDKFDVKTPADRWTLYADAEHLICRLEVRDTSIEYAGYRLVEGMRLPFIQRISIDGELAQEIIFNRITLNPELPPGYFRQEALSKIKPL